MLLKNALFIAPDDAEPTDGVLVPTSVPLSKYIVPFNLQRAVIDFDQLMNARRMTKATSRRRHPYPMIAPQQAPASPRTG